MKKILAFDLGTKTGWCFNDQHNGVEHFTPKNGDHPGKRFLEFQFFVRKLIDKHRPKFIYYEKVEHSTQLYATLVYGGLLSQLQGIAAFHEIPTIPVTVSTLKKFMRETGDPLEKEKLIFEESERGIKKSKQLTLATAKQLGFEPLSDDHADALCLREYARVYPPNLKG